jgi:predicted nuclease of predicted toxin-antitoxin system
VRLFIDECLSPELAKRLNETGNHDAIHPRDYGRLGEPDHLVLRRCLDEDRVIVTQNARDFRKLVGREELHPGLIILSAVGRERSWTMLLSVIAAITRRGTTIDGLVNQVAEVDGVGQVVFADLPSAAP